MKTEKEIREKIKELKEQSPAEFHLWNKAAIASLIWVVNGEIEVKEMKEKIYEDVDLDSFVDYSHH